ncbi:MAG: hypothetical protein H8E15_11020 [Planctomycetes bacterium]|nr:hypothetical protein [Planctomycetota bacterium]
MFTLADFELYQPRFQSDPEWNGRRLDIRKRLQALGDELKKQFADVGILLDRRESLHNPHATNGKKVRRQRTMLFRDKKAKKQLQSFLGRELGKDLDSAVNNVHFQIGLEERQAYWGLRLDRGAWYDLNVLLKRAEEEPGRQQIVAACAVAPGFELLLDGRGARPFETLTSRDWRDICGTVRPGETSLEIRQQMSADVVAQAGEDFDQGVISDLLRLADFFQLASWSMDSPSGASL